MPSILRSTSTRGEFADLDFDERSRALVRDLKAFAANHYAPGGYGPLPGLPTLSADQSLRRLVTDAEPDDWQRIADADPEDLATRLDSWRERGATLVDRDRVVASDFVDALDGDKAALDRLRVPAAEGGHGEHVLAGFVPHERSRADEWRELLSDMQAFDGALGELGADAYHASRGNLEDDYDRPDDADAVRDHEEGDAYGRHYHR